MEILESALAFAVVMIVFSTITTGIVEVLLRSFGTREKNLEKTIRALFELIIWKRLEEKLTSGQPDANTSAATPAPEASMFGTVPVFLRAAVSRVVSLASGKEAAAGQGEAAPRRKEQLLNEFIRAMMDNPVSVAGASASTRGLPARKEGQVDHLSIVAFAERLGRTEVGKAILAEGEKQMELLISDFVRSFDRFARASQEIFRKRARQTAILVGIVVALGANVDVARIFTTLMRNPDLRQGLIDAAATVAEENRKSIDELKSLLATLEKQEAGARTQGSNEQDQGAEMQQTDDAGPASGTPAPPITADDIKAEITKISQRMDSLSTKGLPIGYTYYPYCSADVGGDPNCAEAQTDLQAAWRFLRWVVLCTVAGVLIGLGGPFWFRVFTGLSQVFQVLRSFGIGTKVKDGKEQADDVQPETLPPPEESARAKNVLDAFKVAASVHAHNATGGPRRVLTPDGQPL